MENILLQPDWLQEYPYDVSTTIMLGLARPFAEASGPFSADLKRLVDEGDFLGLCTYKLVYTEGIPVDNYVNARQCLAFFQKLEALDIGVDKVSVAKEAFMAAESKCRETNHRFRAWHAGRITPDPAVASVFYAAQRKIALALGDVPSLSKLDFSFGPGANTTVKARASSPRWKLGAALACSSELFNSVSLLLAQAPSWALLHAVEDDGLSEYFAVDVEIAIGKLQFVPKNAKTYRSIVIEPILNSFAQKGIGAFIKRRLRKVKVDIRSQMRNQMLARIGSLDGSLATVDLSSASDTISKELVASLVPLDWFSFLSRFRTGKVQLNKDILTLEKFSSMGNAFTFELETLLFWGLAMGVCDVLQIRDNDVSVYGDDIIIPVAAMQLLQQTLEFAGFSLNTEKSFSSGPFRESCGADWLSGCDIRPFYQKTLVTGETLFTMHNFFARRFEFPTCEAVLKWIHPSLQIFGPDGYGDGHLIGGYALNVSKKAKLRGWGGGTFDTFTRKKRRDLRVTIGDRILPFYSIYIYKDKPVNQANSQDANGTRFLNRLGEEMSANSENHYVVRGSEGYKRVSIYTLGEGVFLS